MQWLQNIKRSDWIIIGIYWVLMVHLQFFSEWVEEDWPLFSKDSSFLYFNISWLNISIQVLGVLIIVYYLVPTFLRSKQYLLTFLTVILVLIGMQIVGSLLVPLLYPSIFPNVAETLLWGILDNGESISFISFLLIAKNYYESRNELLELQKENKEQALKTLQAQVDPHFLFNNLNILDALIHKDPMKASQFTKRLSSLYRYMIRHKDEDVVSLAEEWAFSDDYLFLLKQRFDDLFEIHRTLDPQDLSRYFIPPAAMQTLLENVGKHNVALPGQPIQVNITVKDGTLSIRNDKRPKKDPDNSSGTGLKNLAARIQLLTDKALAIEETDSTFTVTVPLVRQI